MTGGWPKDESVFKGAKSVVFFMDGGGGHPMIQPKERLETMRRLMDQGVGLVCLHYAVEFPKGEPSATSSSTGSAATTRPATPTTRTTTPRSTPKADHPVSRGVKPFRANDEWYFKIRFRPDDPRVTPVLVAEKLVGHDKKTYTDQVVAWATERKDGGRSLRLHRRPLPQELGQRRLPQARPERHPLDGQARRPLRRASSATSPTTS